VWVKICLINNIHFQGCVEIFYEQKYSSFISVPKRDLETDKILNIIFYCLANVILYHSEPFMFGHISFSAIHLLVWVPAVHFRIKWDGGRTP
jgi:hypothetical protein